MGLSTSLGTRGGAGWVSCVIAGRGPRASGPFRADCPKNPHDSFRAGWLAQGWWLAVYSRLYAAFVTSLVVEEFDASLPSLWI